MGSGRPPEPGCRIVAAHALVLAVSGGSSSAVALIVRAPTSESDSIRLAGPGKGEANASSRLKASIYLICSAG